MPGGTKGILAPVNPSSCAAANSRCAPQLGILLSSNVWSEMAKALANATRLGIWSG